MSKQAKRVSTAFLAVFLLGIVYGCPPVFAQGPQHVILDTDLSSDVDDVGAVAVLHSLADKGEADILAMMVSSGDPWSAPCLDALNTWFGRPDIPIGVVRGKRVTHTSKYTKRIAGEFPHDINSVDEATDAVGLYRKILTAQPDKSVILITIGYLTNLQNLLVSKPDESSPLNGAALVRKKVKKLVCMGGEYPEGREWNFYQDAGAAQHITEQWPTPIVFCGFEVGRDVLTGHGLRVLKTRNPVRLSYELYNGLTDRPSWDQVTVLYGVRGQVSLAAGPWFSQEYGHNRVFGDGTNKWHFQAGKFQAFLRRKIAPSILAQKIEALMSLPLHQEYEEHGE